jgi:hypothetical protein
MFLEIDKDDYDREITTGLHEARRVNSISAVEPGDRVEHAGRDVFMP